MIEKIINISKEAGEIIRDGFGKHKSVEFKTNSSNLVTEIDKESEKLIINFIEKEFPAHTIIAEETGHLEKNSEYTWIIDPLDGTTNFAHGLPIFSVSIGLLKKNEVVCGVVYDVMNDIVYSSEKGGGSFKNALKISVSTNSNLEESLLVTGFPYDIKNNPHKAIEKFAGFLKAARAIRRLGSAALDMCYVASGIFDGFWEVQINPWDIAAGKLIVEEAGGLVTDFNGKPMDVFSPQMLASNGYIHNSMLQILKLYE
ncbi:inositol monophosphatase family protein [Melioribacteraceae bacterium 4301-Me]|uniref:inositol monophosphatase family protein n=1 Tax=Pyranulibacter aquaticus TaxID=3163344 RepID=UPI0035972E93